MNNLTQILSHSTTRLMIWVFIFLFPLLFIWQGGDLTDTGYHVTVYHFFFERLETGSVESLFFLSQLVGALFYNVFPQFGVFGIKILAIIFLTFIFIISHRLLTKKFGDHKLMPLLLISGLLFSARSFPIIFNYDVFTAFWLIVLIFYLHNGSKISNLQMLINGFFIFLMVLSRIPNIVFLGLYPIVYLLFENTKPLKAKFSSLIFLMLGFLFGFGVFILSIYLFKIDSIFVEQIKAFTLLSNSASSYNVKSLIYIYALDIAILLAYILLLGIVIRFVNSKKFYFNHWTILFCCLFLFILLSLYPRVLNYNNHIKYIVPALSIIFIFLSKPKKSEIYFIFLLAISLLTQVAGSNTGITLKFNILFIFLLPYSVLLFLNSNAKNKFPLVYAYISYTALFSFLLLLSGIYGVGFKLFERLKSNHPIDVPNYDYIRTTESQQQKIENIYQDLNLYKNNHKKLFIFGHVPMYYYLTDLPPATEVYWLPGNKSEIIRKIIQTMSVDESILILEQKNLDFLTNNHSDFKEFTDQNNFFLLKKTGTYNIWSNKITNQSRPHEN